MLADRASKLTWIAVRMMVAERIFRVSEQVLPIDE